MRFEIHVTEEAEADLDATRPHYRSRVFDDVETHLRFTPTKPSRSRVKRLRALDSPAYRLRVGDFRVFYDVDEDAAVVTVLRVLSKEASVAYLLDMEGAP